MKIRAILETKGREVRRIEPNETILTAIQTMAAANIGSLMVVDDTGTIMGIVTERDCLREAACNPDFGDRPVAQITTQDIAIAEPDDDLGQVMDTMIAKHCRHVPVIEDGNLAGIISIRDVISERLRETRTELKFMREYITGSHGPGSSLST